MNRAFGRCSLAFFTLCSVPLFGQDASEWPAYGRDPGGTKYSPLDQINSSNVSALARVWSYHTGDPGATWENTPIVAANVMYFATQKNRVVALEPETGKELWTYDPKSTRVSEHRGVSYWPGDSRPGPQRKAVRSDRRGRSRPLAGIHHSAQRRRDCFCAAVATFNRCLQSRHGTATSPTVDRFANPEVTRGARSRRLNHYRLKAGRFIRRLKVA